jgi:hypothetical protein
MFNTKFLRVVGLALLLAINGLALESSQVVRANNQQPTPELPSPLCDGVQVPAGNKLAFRLYAVGTQNYRWNGTAWTFIEPVATLYADVNYHVKVGIHYAGPTWEGNIGGKVTATRVAGCTPDATAIPWLLLQTTANNPPGILNQVTYIQRVNTKGGLAPTAPGVSVGAVAEVSYSTEYYFYQAQN